MFWRNLVLRRQGSDRKFVPSEQASDGTLTKKFLSHGKKIHCLPSTRVFLLKKSQNAIFPSGSSKIRRHPSEFRRPLSEFRRNFWKIFIKKMGAFSQPKIQFTQNLQIETLQPPHVVYESKWGNHHTWLHSFNSTSTSTHFHINASIFYQISKVTITHGYFHSTSQLQNVKKFRWS